MKSFFAVLALALLIGGLPVSADVTPGKLTGGRQYDLPSWFKVSFLELQDDLKEANAHGRQLMLFLHLDDCPYCARTLDENFRQGANKEFIEKHFDVIGLNIRGNREVQWFDGKMRTEMELAQMLKVYATPTILFIDPEGKIALRLNGYRQPPTLRVALEYVQQKAYRHDSLADFAAKHEQAVYTFRAEPMFVDMSDFKGFQKPLAVIFESRTCADCNEFHDKVLHHPDVETEISHYTVVRLDADSDRPITDIDGRRTTPKQWAARLGLTYRPGVVLFNEGKERARHDGMFYHFHFKEMLRYVSGEYYKEYASLSQYNHARRAELLKQGVTIDYSE